jgi:death on curing protein
VIRYLSLAEDVWLAEQFTGIEAAVLARAARIDLVDSALHGPSASFGGEEFYRDVIDKPAVHTCRLVWNPRFPAASSASACSASITASSASSCTRTAPARSAPAARR